MADTAPSFGLPFLAGEIADEFWVIDDLSFVKIEGFLYNSFDEGLVEQVLQLYVNGAGYRAISRSGLPVSFASAQRIVGEAVARGILEPAQKHGVGIIPVARARARQYVQKFPDASPKALSQLADCGVTTIYRAKRGE